MSDKKEAVSYLENNLLLDVDDDTTTDGETLENVAKKPANSKVSRMTVKCLSTSKIIKSPYGEYRIAKIRDTENNKGDLNLNKHNKNKMEVDKIYHIENFKVSDFKNEDSDYRRMATLPTTLIKQIRTVEEKKYSNITLGDVKGTGSCIGIGRVFGYFGCKNCWKKVESEASFCVKCNAPTQDKTMEFSSQLYIEMDEEVVTAQAFKRQFPGLEIDTIDTTDIEEKLEVEFTGKELEFEFNEGGDQENTISLIKIRQKMQ